MKSKGLDFPDNFMDIFGFHRVEKEEVDDRTAGVFGLEIVL